jgi:hypothetical protein
MARLALAVLVVAASSLAAPTEVVVASRGIALTPAVRTAFPKDAKLVDLSAVFHAIYFNDVGGTPFDDFKAPPPPGWPAALTAKWNDAMAVCRKVPAAEAFRCSLTIMGPLWQLAIDSFDDPWVTTLGKSSRKGIPLVEVTRYRARSTAMTLVDVATEPSTAQRDAEALVRKLLAGEDTVAMQRVVEGPLPVKGPAPKSLRLPGLGTANGSLRLTTCARLPGALRFAVAHPISDEVARRWAASASKKPPVATCTLEQTFESIDEGAIPFEEATVTIVCGKARASNTAPMDSPPESEVFLTPILTSLANQFCAQQ